MLLLLFLILSIVFIIISSVVRFIVSFFIGKRRDSNPNTPSSATKRRKIFDNNEGEYVDFEEIKENRDDDEKS